MARPTAFKQKDVLDSVVKLFWKKGFEATSMQDLVDQTGLNRSSLYNSFGSKEALFLLAFDHYVLHFSRERLASLETAKTAKGRLKVYFDDLLFFSIHEGKGLGCLLTNSAVELAPHDKSIKKKLLKGFETVKQTFLKVLKEGQEAGDLAATKDSEALANFFLNTVQGIRVLARAGAPEKDLKQVVKVALSTLDT